PFAVIAAEEDERGKKAETDRVRQEGHDRSLGPPVVLLCGQPSEEADQTRRPAVERKGYHQRQGRGGRGYCDSVGRDHAGCDRLFRAARGPGGQRGGGSVLTSKREG